MPKHEPKYELTDHTLTIGDRTLCRIRALRNFTNLLGDVKVGELGGYVGCEDNLSHEGTCWLSHDAKVLHDARVGENAGVGGQVYIGGHAFVGGDTFVGGDAWIWEHASVGGKAWVCGEGYVGGHACVGGCASVAGNARVGGDARLDGHAYIEGDVHLSTGHFTSGLFYKQHHIDDYLASLETKEQTYAQA